MRKIFVCISIFVAITQHQVIMAEEYPIAGISKPLENVSDNYPEIKRDTHLKPIYQLYTYAVCHRYGVDYDLVLAVIDGESSGIERAFNVNRNGSHDKGLMQINSCNYKWLSKELGVTDFYNPFQNIHCGVFMIADLMDRHSDIHEILMCYNMGEKRTRKLNKQGIYSSKYSRKIIKKYEELKEGKH